MEYLVASQLITDSGLLVLIWLVQLIIYPSFRYIADANFVFWHGTYTALIARVVMPLMLSQVGIEVMHVLFYTPRWLRIGVIAAIWISTFCFSVPCHKRLRSVKTKSAVVERLVKTNWIRTALWSFLFCETVCDVYWSFGKDVV